MCRREVSLPVLGIEDVVCVLDEGANSPDIRLDIVCLKSHRPMPATSPRTLPAMIEESGLWYVGGLD